ncbi:spin [Symbiodinium sp. CCMP2592]|nr:spin [Symbiodinium sp. CCMP2592]
MYMNLAELSVRQRDGLARQLEKWQNPRVEAVLNDERWMEEVAKMRRRFEEVDEVQRSRLSGPVLLAAEQSPLQELSATLQRAREQPQQEQTVIDTAWRILTASFGSLLFHVSLAAPDDAEVELLIRET